MKRDTEDSPPAAHEQASIDTPQTPPRSAPRTPWAALLTALVLLGLGVVWFESGPGLTKRPSRPAFVTREAGPNPHQRAITVRVANARARDFQPAVTLQGSTGAARHVTLRSELDGRIVDVPTDKGEFVRQGEVIVRIAAASHQARLREVEAQLKHRMLEYEAASRLHEQGYRAQTNLALAQANLEAARAARERARKAITDTQIRAPSPGVLNQRDVEIGDYVKVGDPIAVVIDLQTIVVRGRVPERERAMLKLRQRATAQFLNATSAQGTLRYISAVADADTRTYMVEVELPNPQRTIVDGQSVQLNIPGARVAAHQIPASILTVDDDGRLGVKLLGADERVSFAPITVLSQSRAGAWVTGLPAQCRIIVVGQEFVASGDVVSAVDVGPLRALVH